MKSLCLLYSAAQNHLCDHTPNSQEQENGQSVCEPAREHNTSRGFSPGTGFGVMTTFTFVSSKTIWNSYKYYCFHYRKIEAILLLGNKFFKREHDSKGKVKGTQLKAGGYWPHCPKGPLCPHCPEGQLLTLCPEGFSEVYCSPRPHLQRYKRQGTGSKISGGTSRGPGLGDTGHRSGWGKGQGWKQKHKCKVDEPTQTFTSDLGVTLRMNAVTKNQQKFEGTPI